MKLLQNEKNLSNLLHNITSPIIIIKLNYNIIDLNKAAAQLYKWEKKDVIGKNYITLCEKQKTASPLSNKLAKALAVKKIIGNIETSITTGGKEKIVLWKINQLLNDNNQPIGFILFGEDLTKLREEEDKSFRLENIIACMPNNIYWFDKEGYYLGCNDNTAKTLGLSRKEAIGKSLYEELAKNLTVPSHIIADWKKEQKEIMAKRLIITAEEPPFNNAAGKTVYYLSTKVPLYDKHNKAYGVLGISTDISDRKKLEQNLQEAKQQAEVANEAKSNFLAVMSHELRTPLNAILGLAQVVRGREIPQTEKEQIDVILRAGDYLLALIDDVLDFSKLEAGKLEIINEPFDVYQLTQDIITGAQHLLSTDAIKMQATYSKNAPRTLVADPRRVRQIIMNFIGNAVKFTKKGSIKLNITFSHKNNCLKISVKDTGIGIPKSKQSKVFERFLQLESKYTRKYGGAGLGLAICKHLVEEAMHGKIGVKSEHNKGSCFWFTIPLTLKPVRKSKRVHHEKIDIENVEIKPGHILVIEDTIINQLVLKAMLGDVGCTVDVADNGKAALRLFKKKAYDIILTDLSLPDMNGLEIIAAMRADKKNKNRTKPIIAVTAHVLEEDRQNCLKAGANEVLTKPIMMPKLKSILYQWIK